MLDVPLGSLLYLPRDLAILIVAIGTSLLLTIVRKWTTPQDRLRRGKADLKRLKQLRREAKRARDKEAVRRIRTTIGMIQVMRMKAEGLPLLVSIVPIALLACWAFARLDYYPPQKGDELTVEANYRLSSAGKLAHMVPPENVEVSRPIQVVRVDTATGANGIVKWTIRPTSERSDTRLIFRHDGQTVTHPLSVGGVKYAPAIQQHSGQESGKITATMVQMERARFLGIVPGIPQIMFAPWLVAYLLIAMVFVPVLRHCLKIY
jgi:hypothetical protein